MSREGRVDDGEAPGSEDGSTLLLDPAVVRSACPHGPAGADDRRERRVTLETNRPGYSTHWLAERARSVEQHERSRPLEHSGAHRRRNSWLNPNANHARKWQDVGLLA